MAGQPSNSEVPNSADLVVEISLAGRFDQKAISLKNLPFSDLERFPRDVAQFVTGSNKSSLAATSVEIKEGSIRLVFLPPANVRENLFNDLQSLAASPPKGSLRPDPERSKILNRWQRRAMMEDHYSFTISMGSSTIVINSGTAWKLPENEEAIAGEYMVLGEVEDAGGESPNIHIVDSKTNEPLIVTASREQIRAESHPVYNRKLLHVSAEKSRLTGRLSKVKLIRFVNYSPEIDEDSIRKMLEKGSEIFRGVKDAGKWIRAKRDIADAS